VFIGFVKVRNCVLDICLYCVKQQIVNLNHSCICLRLILSVDYNTPFTRVGAVELHFSLQDHGVKG
jgi:hypothetical protein